MKKLIYVASILFLSTNVFGATAKLQLSYTISQGDSVIASPIIVVEQGKQARISIGDGGVDDVTLSVIAIPIDNRAVSLRHQLRLGQQDYAPSVDVRKGDQAMVKIGDLTLEIRVDDYAP